MKRLFLSALLTALFCTAGSAADAKISLDGMWRFKADHYNTGMEQKWYSPGTDDSLWDMMPVPGNWDIRNEYVDFAGKGWYRTSFRTPDVADGKTLLLTFEAVHIDYTVWLNGERLGDVTGGFFPETFDITGRVADKGNNQLTVCVDNTFRSGAYWNWGGIRRPVTVETVSPFRLDGMKVTSEPDLRSGKAKITIDAAIIGGGNGPATIELSLFFKGKQLAHKTIEAGGGSVCHTFTLSARNTHLWHFDRPNLYECTAVLKKGGETISAKSVRTGIRKVEVRDGVFLLNGEAVRTAGLNWVADHRFSGNTLPGELYRKDIDMMKTAGATMARLSHLPLPADVYEYMDSVGMMVIDEIPIWGQSVLVRKSSPLAEEWLGKMVNNHYNHPCIIGWSVGNEYGNVAKNPESIEYTAGAVKYIKSLDPTRVVVEVSNSSHRQIDDPTQFSDMACLNVYTVDWGAKADITHSRHPGKPLYISEYGRDLIPEEVNDAREDFADILAEFRARPWIFGFSLWTYNDYRSSWSSDRPNWETYATGNRAWGIVDACRNPKRAYYNIRREYSPVKNMEAAKTGAGHYDVTLTPRGKNDIPAYVMDGYSIICEQMDAAGEIAAASSPPLPRILPGDGSVTVAVKAGQAAAVKFSLANPMGYRLADTTIYNSVPAKPVIKEVFASGTTARAVYGATPLAEEHMLELDGELSAPSIAWYAEKKDLKPGKYRLRLVASNGSGKSFSDPVEVTVASGTILPPVIFGVESNSGGINIAYSSERTDYAYTVEYTDSSGTVRTFQTRLKGGCFIPELRTGEYRVRIRRIDQENITSPWSEYRSVMVE